MDFIMLILFLMLSVIMGMILSYKLLSRLSVHLRLKIKRMFNPKKNYGLVRILRPGKVFTQDIINFDDPNVQLKYRNEGYSLDTNFTFSEEGYPIAFFNSDEVSAVPVFKNQFSKNELIEIKPTDLSIGMYKAEQHGWIGFKDSTKSLILFIGLVGFICVIGLILTWMQGNQLNQSIALLQNVSTSIAQLNSTAPNSMFIPAG